MKKTVLSFAVLALVSVAVAVAAAPTKHKPLSPHETVSKVIDKSKISISYGRPYIIKPGTKEVRKIWGGLVPYGKVWRTGANEATLLKTSKALAVNGVTIPAGSYSLFTIPEEGSAKLVVNKQTGQWGTEYDEKQDLARIDLKKDSLNKPVNQFTITIEKNPSGGGIFKMEWEKTAYSTPFTVPK